MHISGILISNKAHLLVISRELQLFLRTYVAVNIEGYNPSGLDPNFLACDLQKNLERAFNARFSVSPVDSETGDPIDDLTYVAALEVSTPVEFPTMRSH
jgi:hypothetical protein